MLISGECLAKEDFRGRSVTRVRIDKNVSLQQLRLGISQAFFGFTPSMAKLNALILKVSICTPLVCIWKQSVFVI